MKKNSAEQNLIDFLKENPDWHNSGQLQRMPFKNKNGSLATPRTLVRRLQENAEGDQAILEVKYEGQTTYYKIKTEHIKKKQVVEQLPNGSVRVSYLPINKITWKVFGQI